MSRRSRGLAFLAHILTSVMVVSTPGIALGAVSVTWDHTWGATGYADGEFNDPADVTADKWGNVYVAGGESGDNRIQMFSPEGAFIRSVGTTVVPSPLLWSPRSITTDRWGNIYVAEKGNNGRIHMFNPTLYSDVRTWDGAGDSAIGNPNGIAVSLEGTVYLNENGTEIQRWTPYGDYLGKWAPYGGSLVGLGAAQDGSVYSSAPNVGTQPNTVTRYNPLGVYLTHWGGTGTAAGLFQSPYDVSTDGAENVYTIEAAGNRGQVFRPNGTHLTTFGAAGSDPDEFGGPYGIAAAFDRTVYVANTLSDRISKWNVTTATETTQVAGDSRYTTAIEASKRAYPNGASTVVIATGENWPDALGGAALAGAVRGPLLLTSKNSLPSAVRDEIIRLHVGSAYILGSEDAVSGAVYDAVDDLMIMAPPIRLGGADRYTTANLIATEAIRLKGDEYDGTVFIATGENFPDALAASPIAAANVWPIYLTRKAALPASVKATMIANLSWHGYILGSTDAVSAAVATELNSAPFIDFGRYGGANRYDTAARIATIGYDGMGMLWSRPALAVGTNFPDALAGGVLQGSDYSVILLTPKDSLDPYTAAALAANKDMIYELRFLGSTSALGTTPRNAARALLW